MSMDERVRGALHNHAERIEPADGSRQRIQQRVHEARRRRRLGWAGGATGAVAAAVLLVVAVASLAGNGSRVVETGPAGTGSMPTAPPPPSDAPPPIGDVGSAGLVPGIWPLHTVTEVEDYRDSGDTRYDDPVEVARAFATDYLGMIDPVVDQTVVTDEMVTVEVVLSPRGESGQPVPPGVMDTIVELGLLLASGPDGRDRPDGPWNVLSTTSSSIRLDGDSFRTVAGSPIAVSGEATAYEGTVQVEVRQAGMETGEALGRGMVTAGAQGNLEPFAAEIAFDPPSTDGLSALVLFTESAVDGSTLEATVVALTMVGGISTPTTAPGETEVTVFFHRGEELVAVTRTVPATTGVLRASLEQLLAGPTDAEQSAGLSSWFSEKTERMLLSVTLEANDTAVVDLGDLRSVIPNASTSAGSEILLAQLNATVFQFPTVASVEYRIEGSCDAFFEWLQRGCEVIERPGG